MALRTSAPSPGQERTDVARQCSIRRTAAAETDGYGGCAGRHRMGVDQ
eukprot:CAMPEP_0117688738 /NCGR_PEP_ID=MMETSP0804-20121206/24031_1 /TAXON_ID=1074897 /ORGANISM="Tetraselmis astigmatica, Strain CCMP880" /LENGTH=47 /DNA_ID= /DNA_START= /DNA_END= /DNA_ORIENTATION=